MKLSHSLLAAIATAALAGTAWAGPGEDLIATEKCSKCHTATTTKKGPSFSSVAAKYKGKPEAADRLVMQLKNGGKVGDEEDHKKVKASDADLKAIVDVVLSTK